MTLTKSTKKLIEQFENENKAKKVLQSQFYNLRPILGHFNWAMVACLLGGREAGKSYAVTNYFVDSYVNKGIPFTWLRLTDTQMKKLLNNNAENLIDPDIRRKYNLEIVTSGNNVYQVVRRSKPDANGKTKILEKKLMARVFALSNFYNQKGSGLFDKDFLKDLNMQYHVALDEFEKEEGEKKQGDILYQFVNQMENLIRSTKTRIKVFIIGNMLDTCADIMAGLNFIPEEFGTYKLKSKRVVIDYMEPTDAYKERRKGSFADLWLPHASTFTNVIETDNRLIDKRRVGQPRQLIKFTKDKSTWFCLYDHGIIDVYKNQNIKNVIAMRPYLDELFDSQLRDNVMMLFNSRSYHYKNLIAFKKFQKQLELLKKN